MGGDVTGSGRLLAGAELRAVLDAGRVFEPGSWRAGQVRAAGYDLTVSGSELLLAEDGVERMYEGAEVRLRPFVLRPGETAVVSSEERLCLDFDVTGMIGTKFSQASQGLLVLTGTGVDPGYGRASVDGAWVPRPQRLHFVIANVGQLDVVIVPGQTRIAHLQMFEVAGVEPSFTPSEGWANIRDASLKDGVPTPGGLAYFRNVRDMGQRVDEALQVSEQTRAKVDQIRDGSNFVVVFGVFLVAVTLLAGALEALLDALGEVPELASGEARWAAWLAVVVFVCANAGLVWVAVTRTGAVSLPGRGAIAPKGSSPAKRSGRSEKRAGSGAASGSAADADDRRDAEAG